jgi:Oxidoreductase molybdopterin binding domain
MDLLTPKEAAKLVTVRTPSLRTSQAVLIMLTWAAVACLGDAQEIAVQNDSSAPVNVTATDITAMPHQKVSVDDHGKTVTFEGVPLRLVLEKGGVAFGDSGDSLRGKRLSSCLLVEAADGYRVVVALPELDPEFTDRIVLLADRADGHPLDTKEGPFRIVIPGEKRMARWVRQVIALKVVQVQ